MYNLLIIDDEYEIRQALSNYIPWGEMGFSVVGTAENGEEGLNFINENEVDVVLCDIKMPVIDGIKFAEIVDSQNIETKIVFLSAYREFNFAKKALLYGVEDYVVKPTKYQELLDVFNKVKYKLDQENTLSKVEVKKSLGVKQRKNNDKKVYMKTRDSVESFNEKIIIKAKKIIKENYKSVSLKEVAAKVHLSSSYLSKLFKEVTGENFSDYVLKTKMEEAKKLLMDIDYCIYEVSDILGYSNPKNFSRAFKSFTGKSPSEYRKGDLDGS